MKYSYLNKLPSVIKNLRFINSLVMETEKTLASKHFWKRPFLETTRLKNKISETSLTLIPVSG